jgi:hypothetical protein
MTCIRAGCNEEDTHVVRSGDVGIGYCDKHWKERDEGVEGSLLMQ